MTWLAETAMLSYGWRRFLMLLVAGAIAGLSVPPLFVLPALFVTFPFWVWALDGAERRPGLGRLFGPAFAIGFAFGLGYFTVAFHWLGQAFFLEGGWPLFVMPFAIVGLAALIALFWGLASALAHLFWSHSGSRVVVLATFLSLAEYARGTLFSGFPFDLLGYALTANPEMMQLASVIGMYGLTALCAVLVLTPALIWPADERGLVRRLVPFFLAVAAIAAQIAWGNQRLTQTIVADRTDMRVRMVQPIITEHSEILQQTPPEIVSRLIALSEQKTDPADQGLADITQLIWPESVLPFYLSSYPEGLARIARMLPAGTTLLTGAPREPEDRDGDPLDNPGYNSILAIDSDGEITQSYAKSHLVPFGEYLPFAGFWKLFGIRQFVPGTNGWQAGDGKRLMTPPGMPAFIALICYEAIFSGDLGADPNKAEFLLNISNDEWFDGSIGNAQHAHHARLRAVESGLPMLRATNSGDTMLIDPLGRITAALPAGEQAVLDVVPSEKLPGTIFNRVWHWPFFVALALGLIVAMATRRRTPRKPA
ncbi:MAG: apolipoprotein N-acyltransferase [Devosia sp.]